MSCNLAYTTTPVLPVAEQKHLVCVCVKTGSLIAVRGWLCCS